MVFLSVGVSYLQMNHHINLYNHHSEDREYFFLLLVYCMFLSIVASWPAVYCSFAWQRLPEVEMPGWVVLFYKIVSIIWAVPLTGFLFLIIGELLVLVKDTCKKEISSIWNRGPSVSEVSSCQLKEKIEHCKKLRDQFSNLITTHHIRSYHTVVDKHNILVAALTVIFQTNTWTLVGSDPEWILTSECCVCQNQFKIGDIVLAEKRPPRHLYHYSCIRSLACCPSQITEIWIYARLLEIIRAADDNSMAGINSRKYLFNRLHVDTNDKTSEEKLLYKLKPDQPEVTIGSLPNNSSVLMQYYYALNKEN